MHHATSSALRATILTLLTGAIAAQAGFTIHIGSDPVDDAPTIRAAIASAVDWLTTHPNSGPASVVFETNGVYHLDSASPGPDMAFVLDIRGVPNGTDGLYLKGNGATLLNRGAGSTKVVLGINTSHRVTVEDLTFDLDALPYMDSTVQSVTDTGIVTIKRIRGTPIASFPAAVQWGWLLDPQVPGRPKAGSRSSYHISWTPSQPNSEIYESTLAPAVAAEFAPGDRFIHQYRAGGSSIQVRGVSGSNLTTNITLRNIRSFASVANVINAQWVDGLYVTGCEAAIAPDAWQSTNSDGLHIKNSSNVYIEGCRFAGMADDAINLSLVNHFTVRACDFTNKRRHAIILDSDDAPSFTLANSKHGLIELNQAIGNGGSFLVHRGGDYATVTIRSNRHTANNLNRAEGRCWQVHMTAPATNGIANIVPLTNANGSWTHGAQAVAAVGTSGAITQWDMQEVLDGDTSPTEGFLFTNRALRDVNIWLYLAPTNPTAGSAVTMQQPTGPLNDASHFWLSESINGTGTVRFRLKVTTLYLSRDLVGNLTVQPLSVGNPLQEWTLTAAPGN